MSKTKYFKYIKWKEDAPYAVCLTHDVDRLVKQWYHYIVYCKKGIKVQIHSLHEKVKGDEPYNNIKRIAELEISYGARSTFLFLNESHKELSVNFLGRYSIESDHVVEKIQWLDEHGFEIGLHGSYYSFNNATLLKHEKFVLENIVGHPIVSTRQHFLNYDNNTLKLHKSLGLKYDSTVGNKKTTGENFPAFPYYQDGMIEMPITVMDTVKITDQSESDMVVKACMNVALRGGLVMLNFHQRQLRDTEYPFVLKTYERLLKMARRDSAWIATMKEIGDYIACYE